jgi:DNA-binding NarL/FixJ family response regulator
MRIVIADDAMLLREGTARLLEDAGFDVVGKVDDAQKLMRAVALEHPDVAIVDIKMPPTYTDEGLVAAEEIKALLPGYRSVGSFPIPGIRVRHASSGATS